MPKHVFMHVYLFMYIGTGVNIYLHENYVRVYVVCHECVCVMNVCVCVCMMCVCMHVCMCMWCAFEPALYEHTFWSL